MNRTALFVFALFAACTSATAQVSFGDAEKINDGWSFILRDVENGSSKELDQRGWQKVQLPHDWSVKGQLSPSLASCTGYLPGGIGWYRKNIDIPVARKDDKVYLYFEGVYNRSEVYLNGHLLGRRPNGYISFMYDATPYVEFGGQNVLAVRVDHSRSADSRWYTGSGIYRDAWIVYADPVHISQWGVFAWPVRADRKQGVLGVEVALENGAEAKSELTVVNELFNADGKQVARSSKKISLAPGSHDTVSTELKVSSPMLWSLDTPDLYSLHTTVLRDGQVIDKSVTTTGFRTFTFDPDKGFALNGEWFKVKGVCIHHDGGVLGSAVPREVWKRRLENLQKIGCNAVRTSHNPQAPFFYELCDELGMLVIDEASDEWEFPKRKWLEGWNVGTPGFEGSYDFFEEWGEKDLADMVRRDRNHMSVFAWSIGNEVDYPNDPYSHPVLDGGNDGQGGFTQATFGGYKPDSPDAMRLGAIAKRMAATVKAHDRSRPVTAGLAGVAMSNETEYPGALDIAGYNYTESRYGSDHEKYPSRVIFGSENRHDLAAWQSVTDNDHIFGQFLWTGIDYLGESGRWPSRGFYSGLLDFGGFMKPRGYYRMSLWSDQPMAYVGTYPAPGHGGSAQATDVWSAMEAENAGRERSQPPSMDAWPVWNYQPGQMIRVVCYTNADKARLLLDGKEIGAMREHGQEDIIHWDVPYTAGTLEAVGYDSDGKEVSRYSITSSDAPHAIRITDGLKKISKDRGVTQLTLQIVDNNGVPVILSDQEITCRISGPARLLGMEAGDNSDMGDYTDNRHRVYHGRMIVYIEATGEAGEAQVQFTSPWLASAQMIIDIE